MRIPKEQLRDYALGRIKADRDLEEVEKLLVTDEDTFSKFELIEEELIDAFVSGELNENDRADFALLLKQDSKLRDRVFLEEALRNEFQQKQSDSKAGWFSLEYFTLRPLLSGALVFGGLILVVSIYLQFSSNRQDQLASLIGSGRPFESRIERFSYRPFSRTRGKNENAKDANRLRLIENSLLEATLESKDSQAFHDLGVFYLLTKEFEKARLNLETASRKERSARIENDLGVALHELSKTRREPEKTMLLGLSNESFAKAIRLDKESPAALFNRGLVLRDLGFKSSALKSFEQFKSVNTDVKWESEADQLIAAIKNETGRNFDRESTYESAISALRKNDLKVLAAVHDESKGVLNGAALVQAASRRRNRESNELLQALARLDEERFGDKFVREIAKDLQRLDRDSVLHTEAQRSFDSAVESVYEGEYSVAIRKFEVAKSKFAGAGQSQESLIAEYWIAELLPDVGKTNEAEIRLQRLEKIVTERGFKSLLSGVLFWQSVVSYRNGDKEESLRRNKKALEAARNVNNVYEISHSAEFLSGLHLDFAKIERATSLLFEAIRHEGRYFSSKGQVWRNRTGLGSVLEYGMLRFTALDAGFESLEIAKNGFSGTEVENYALERLGQRSLDVGDQESARKYSLESLQLAESAVDSPEKARRISNAQLERAKILSSTDECGTALPLLNKADEYSAETSDSKFRRFEIGKYRLKCFDSLGEGEDFESEFRRLSEYATEIRLDLKEENELAFFENEQDVFDIAVLRNIKIGKRSKALSIANVNRGRLLLEEGRSSSGKESLLESPLSDSESVVFYHVLPDSIAIWFFERGIERFELIEEKEEVQAAVRELRSLLKNPGHETEKKVLSKWLGKKLFPFRKPKNRRILVILDKFLHQIPFGALVLSDDEPMAKNYAIVIGRSLEASRNGAFQDLLAREPVFIVSDPAFDQELDSDLVRLPETLLEVEAIEKIVGKVNGLSGREADSIGFRKGLTKDGIFHFAGHFVISEREPEKSYFALADGRLSLQRLRGARVNPKLVVLSACNTTASRIGLSEGPLGAVHSFLAGGAKLVVSGNWDVESKAAGDFMAEFYKAMQRKRPEDAFAEARRKFIELHPDPNVWAAFSITRGSS